ncbi:Gfo/Idh/MocA family protein [Sphingobacterium sp. BN32]|uniref:Gfo/Idh/MocA family protein n=1 Tax=Sphingobacterium sp. BN32 TaxID=3058432 RepID=UPI00265D00A2|nr:Gfo/Idh/MocA family oxidoreductase [Sphingobacterium sp. BN32]WKK58715.1 Gfo/Idh/MocA family oxidoreductase [Sphingobacterium sp. BN32]
MKTVNVGIIGGGLMGKEAASAFGRWFALKDFPVQVQLTAVCDIDQQALSWYKQISSVSLLTTDYKELIHSDLVDVVYIAVPHHMHESLYIDILQAGKDLLGEKPFGIDLAAARRIAEVANQQGRFARCSSEMPFFPGPQRVVAEVKSGRLGRIIEIKAGFLHASDMNPNKPINWKRQSAYCGEIGVMGDLGIHALHIPLRLGWKPQSLYAHLQKIITERPDGKGGMANADTWNNATLSTRVQMENGETIPMSLEMKRLAPGETNTWFIEVLGTEGGIRYSTKDVKALWTYNWNGGKEQSWQRVDLGFEVPFPTVTGGIFEPGFPDVFQQMLAAYFAEREGELAGRFGCVTLEEAIESHEVFAAALESHTNNKTVLLAQEVAVN